MNLSKAAVVLRLADLRQEQRGPLTRRQMLKSRDKREADALTQGHELERIRVGREGARIGDRIEPVRARARLELFVHGAVGTLFHRSSAARPGGQRVEADVGRDPVHPRPK